MIHEDRTKLSDKTLDLKRAIDSLKEELEAVDWYNQRADACKDENLKKILIHNANEEKEHAAMLIEWIRQNDKDFGKEFKEYLFSENSDITSLETKKRPTINTGTIFKPCDRKAKLKAASLCTLKNCTNPI